MQSVVELRLRLHSFNNAGGRVSNLVIVPIV